MQHPLILSTYPRWGGVEEDKEAAPLKRKIAEKRIDGLEHFRPTKGRLLEIGFGYGYTLEEANRRGWRCEGVELSEHAVAIATDKGLWVYSGEFTEIKFERNSYDAVTAYSIIEHHKSPRKMLTEIREILKPGGIAIIRLPYLEKEDTPLLSLLEHFYHFTLSSFESLLSQTGFQIISREMTGVHQREYGITKSVTFVVRKEDGTTYMDLNKLNRYRRSHESSL